MSCTPKLIDLVDALQEDGLDCWGAEEVDKAIGVVRIDIPTLPGTQ